ncbi:MAG TPA: MoaD/ThiS family protein [Burkholderiales bacterium]
MKVYVPSPLSSYTQEATTVDATGGTVAELLEDLDRRYPGIRFRIISEQDQIRRHIRIFVNREQVRSLAVRLRPADEVMIVGALSGG